MSFKAVQTKIAGEGYGAKAAGAILASATRKASPAAKKANPALNRVKMPKVSSIRIQPAHNGGFVSHTTMASSKKPGSLGGPWEERQELVGQHSSLNALKGHLDKTFGKPKAAAPSAPAKQPAWAGVASKMLQ